MIRSNILYKSFKRHVIMTITFKSVTRSELSQSTMLKLFLAITLLAVLAEASDEMTKAKAIAAAKTFCAGSRSREDREKILGHVMELCKTHTEIPLCELVENPEVIVDFVVKHFCEPMEKRYNNHEE